MKKLISLLTMLAVLVSASAYAGEFDMSPYTSTKAFEVDVDTDKGVAFIETICTVEQLAFTHKYESPYSYSSFESDILVTDYFDSDRFPVLRTWIYYAAEKPQYIHSVSFEINGKRYTFTDVGDKDRIVKRDSDYMEQLLIKYGSNNSEFISTILAEGLAYAYSVFGNDNETAVAPTMKMTLHGLEDIEADVPDMFWVDISLLVVPMLNNETLGYIGENDGTPCKITDIK